MHDYQLTTYQISNLVAYVDTSTSFVGRVFRRAIFVFISIGFSSSCLASRELLMALGIFLVLLTFLSFIGNVWKLGLRSSYIMDSQKDIFDAVFVESK